MGYFIAVTSNFDSRLRRLLQEFEISPHVDFLALSGELGIAKPDPEIFRVLMRRFDLSTTDEILHIGDDYEKDYLASRNFGSYAYLVSQSLPNINIVQEHVIRGISDIVK